MVNLTRIYTRTGDDGDTHLGDMSRVPKTHPRVEAYGTVDELNAQLGVAAALGGLPPRLAEWLARIQNDLLDVGADLSVPPGGERTRLRVTGEYVQWLEGACDEVNAALKPLRSFVIPGGTPAAAQLHVCRTVCRRAERRALAVTDGSPEVIRYLNRLSDLLFIISRALNEEGEELWEPGAHRARGPTAPDG
jgi:cob(I)alamin adenosyltransferase